MVHFLSKVMFNCSCFVKKNNHSILILLWNKGSRVQDHTYRKKSVARSPPLVALISDLSPSTSLEGCLCATRILLTALGNKFEKYPADIIARIVKMPRTV